VHKRVHPYTFVFFLLDVGYRDNYEFVVLRERERPEILGLVARKIVEQIVRDVNNVFKSKLNVIVFVCRLQSVDVVDWSLLK
jgi:hypothetical protein